MACAAALADPDSPAFDQHLKPVLTKSLLARTLGFSRHSYYYRPKLPAKDTNLADHIRRIYKDDDDTLGAKKLAKQLSTETSIPINHKRVARVMRAQALCSRPKKAKYRYPGQYGRTIYQSHQSYDRLWHCPVSHCRTSTGSDPFGYPGGQIG